MSASVRAREEAERVTVSVLSDLAFLFADPAEAAGLPETPPAPYWLARMTFSGPQSGGLELALPVSLAPQIAANMLGVEESECAQPGPGKDAVKELLNVICGQILTTVAGTEPVFDLSVPEVTEVDDAAWRALRDRPGIVALQVDDLGLLLHLDWRG